MSREAVEGVFWAAAGEEGKGGGWRARSGQAEDEGVSAFALLGEPGFYPFVIIGERSDDFQALRKSAGIAVQFGLHYFLIYIFVVKQLHELLAVLFPERLVAVGKQVGLLEYGIVQVVVCPKDRAVFF